MEDYYKYRNCFNKEIFVEDDSPEGIMISIDMFEYYDDTKGTCHLPKDEAIKLANYILKITKDE